MDGSHACLNEIVDGAVVVHGPGRRLRCHDSNGYRCQVGKTPRRLFLDEAVRQPRLLSLADFAPQFSWAFEGRIERYRDRSESVRELAQPHWQLSEGRPDWLNRDNAFHQARSTICHEPAEGPPHGMGEQDRWTDTIQQFDSGSLHQLLRLCQRDKEWTLGRDELVQNWISDDAGTRPLIVLLRV